MRIGIVSHWFNRGQGTVGRHLRSIFDGLSHETFVLARPTQDHFVRPRFVDRGDVWDQPGLTIASHFRIPGSEYLNWARECRLDAAFFDQNYQFDEVARLRSSGVKTIGRFVWESFAPSHVVAARSAFNVIYSLTQCEQRRYQSLGIDSPLMRWGCHPELLEYSCEPAGRETVFFYPGGYLSKRKPTEAVIRAFELANNAQSRLIIKTQDSQQSGKLQQHVSTSDSRITVCHDDLPNDEYCRLFASAHICLAPSRWEGLGLHLYEATAFGMPVITNDNPPMNEVVRHDVNGALVKSHQVGAAASGIGAFEPDVDDLARAIIAACDPATLLRWQRGARQRREELAWSTTIAGFDGLVTQFAPQGAGAAR